MAHDLNIIIFKDLIQHQQSCFIFHQKLTTPTNSTNNNDNNSTNNNDNNSTNNNDYATTQLQM
ncbi:hypothetical protein MTR_1g048800 [Medicago truncatula]|uniref:Uncharacterized protein n=1 Tax=Medicago truncatula TaxID=3880 RepID=A0A072VIT2_MEDTR|nr:hypothetical protein MTR_1g048800 [Medicago truncatula]